MRLERQAGQAGTPPLGAVLGGVLLASAGVAVGWRLLGLPLPVCRFREWTGIPCPTCGSTRMVEALLAGDVAGALAWNPLVFLVLTTLALWGLLSAGRLAFGRPARHLVLSPRERTAVWVFAGVALLAGWAYLVWRGV